MCILYSLFEYRHICLWPFKVKVFTSYDQDRTTGNKKYIPKPIHFGENWYCYSPMAPLSHLIVVNISVTISGTAEHKQVFAADRVMPLGVKTSLAV